MEPAETGGMLAAEDGLLGFAVVFEGPHGIPEISARVGGHAAFPLAVDPDANDVADCYDLVNLKMMGPCRKQFHLCACNRN